METDLGVPRRVPLGTRTYTWRADNGDRAIITFEVSAGTRSDVSEFCIVVGILPLPTAQMREQNFPLPKAPHARDGVFSGKVWPGHAGYDSTRSWWQLPENDVASMGPVLRTFLVDGIAPMLVWSLNRDILLRWDADSTLMPETVDWNVTGQGRLDLIADTAPPEQIDAEIERMRAIPYANPDWLIRGFSYLADRYPDRYSHLRQEIEQLRARHGVAINQQVPAVPEAAGTTDESASGRDERSPWQRAAFAFNALLQELQTLERDYSATVRRLQLELHGMRRMDAIYILRLLDDEYTAALVKDLVNAYLSEKSRLQARETLDRLPRRELAHLVPAAAWQLLEELEGDEYGDDYQYELIAQLFDELGLQDAFPELAERALTSSDPAVRSTGEWIREEFLAR